jgi:hypothetical protein
MMPPAAILAPRVRIFSGKAESFVQDGDRWRRMSSEDEAHSRTGYDGETHEPSIGIYVTRRPNELLRIGFDIFKLNVNLRRPVIERIESRWRQEAASLSKSLLRSVSRRVHFSKSFMRFEVSPERIDAWQLELESILSDPNTYESI